MAATKSNTRKPVRKKSSAPQKRATKPKQASKSPGVLQREHRRRQASAVLMFVIGVLTLCLVLIEGKNVWLFLHNAMLGIFGGGAIAVPILLIYLSIVASLNKNMGRMSSKLWQSLVLVCFLCSFIQLIFVGSYVGDNVLDTLVTLFETGKHWMGGGLLSSVVGWPLQAACGTTGAMIIIVLFLFAFVLLITGATLMDAFRTMSKPVRNLEQHYVRKREEREQKFNINVNLGPDGEEMPQHPVSSRKMPEADIVSVMEQETNKQNPAEAFIRMVKNSKKKKQPEPEQENKNQQLDELVKKAIPVEPEKTIDIDLGKEEEVKEAAAATVPFQSAGAEATNMVLYHYPPVSLLKIPTAGKNTDLTDELKANAELLVNTLKSFGVQTRVIDISRGPTVTRYELQPSAGVKISKITGLADDIALNLAAAGVRIEAPIPNKAAVGIEVPNRKTDIVTIREMIDSDTFRNANSKLSVALGRDISGREIVFDIGKMPHMLIAGATGSGKSVCINALIISLMYKSTPDEVRLLMIDPKVVELGIYNGIPHLLVPVVTDPRKAAGALGWAVTEMLNRYKLFADNSVRDLSGYNSLAKSNTELDPLPQIVIIIDELADLMMAAPNEVEDAICRLAQMARAAGMHLVIATQRPSVDVITGVIKANIPSRIAFSVSSQVDSRTILDSGGAEKLLGRGDMLFYPVGMPKPVRLQCCYVSDKEVEQVVNFVKNSATSDYDEKIIGEIERQAVQEKSSKDKNEGGGFDDEDDLLPNAIECVIEASQASTSYLQRKLKIGYARAARLMDDMETKGIIGPSEGSKPRQVMMTRNQWIEMNMNRSEEPAEV